jgi:histidyl-tRNA synthetase
LQASVVAERLRDAGLDVILHCASSTGIGSFKSQMKRADSSGAAYAVIIGEDEIAQGNAVVKEMRAGGEGQQSKVPFDGIADYLVDQMVGGDDDHDHDHQHVHYHP